VAGSRNHQAFETGKLEELELTEKPAVDNEKIGAGSRRELQPSPASFRGALNRLLHRMGSKGLHDEHGRTVCKGVTVAEHAFDRMQHREYKR
jgi:hypothetical protein